MRIKRNGIYREVNEHDLPKFIKMGYENVEEPAEEDIEEKYLKMKKDEIKALLTEKGIEFDDSMKKEDLLALLP